jgi:GMP synthase-like glutamine amidotransferase
MVARGEGMRVHFVQHVPFEGPGSIGGWTERRRAITGWTRLFAGESLPPIDDVDLLIVLGGPMSVNDVAQYPWLTREIEYLRSAISGGARVLGICLGAQLIASALGARVYPNTVKEIGWYDVDAISASSTCFCFPPTCLAFHWHGETFDLPEGAVHLARSERCEHQAIQWGRRVLGLQFHLETTPESVVGLVRNCRDEIDAEKQGEGELLAAEPSRYAEINALMEDVLDYLAGD